MQHTGSTLPQWAKNLKEYRKKQGLNQAEFGEMWGVTAMAVSYWEAGRTEPPARVLTWMLVESGVVSRASVNKLFGEG
jgi:transcriptional regulator with XRE-family HTH domain